MRTGRVIPTIGLLTAALTAGCVDRRFVIESNVPNAQVFIDNKPVGAAPVDAPFEYYGYYNITLVHPNYAPLVKRTRVRPPWYAYPPFDFFAEVLWPFRIEDTRRYFFRMEQSLQVPTGTLVGNADQLRQRGWALPEPPPHPQAPLPGDPVVPADGTILPSPAPLPEGNPIYAPPRPEMPIPVPPTEPQGLPATGVPSI